MTSIKEYVELGIDEATLISALKSSAQTKSLAKADRVYVGIPNKSRRIPDGSDYGRLEQRAGSPVLLTFRRESKRWDFWVHRIAETGELWGHCNSNVTLSPWDCDKLLIDTK